MVGKYTARNSSEPLHPSDVEIELEPIAEASPDSTLQVFLFVLVTWFLIEPHLYSSTVCLGYPYFYLSMNSSSCESISLQSLFFVA